MLFRAVQYLTDRLYVFLVRWRKDQDIFHDSTCVWNVVEHVRNPSPKVVTGVSDAHEESDVLESAERRRERRERR